MIDQFQRGMKKTIILTIMGTLLAVLGLFGLWYMGFKEGWRQSDESCPKATAPAKPPTSTRPSI